MSVDSSGAAGHAHTQQQQPSQQPQQPEEDQEDLFPPDNFSMVDAGIYRSSFPMKKHFPFLRKLGLRTILTLVIEELPPANLDFVQAHGIRLVQIGVEGNKEPFKYIPLEEVQFAVQEMSDPSNHPMLVHCNKGKHRTGCLIGCFRRTQGWAVSSIFEEYTHFASPKDRLVDQRYIELFQPVKAGTKSNGRNSPRVRIMGGVDNISGKIVR
ncbi:unnamed protein product [Scytosiphon promiscuus]